MNALRLLNLGLRFLLELGILAALGYWGVRTGRGTAGKLTLALGVELATATAWGLFVSPRAKVALKPALKLVVELAIFGAAAAALAWAGKPLLAAVFAGVALLNALLLRLPVMRQPA